VTARPPTTLRAVAVGADEALFRRLAYEGRAAYRVEARAATRRRIHLQSAKILDGAGAFLCEATIVDVSARGMRLLLARNCGLPSRFGVHVDMTGQVLTAVAAWRRDRLIGARVVAHAAPARLKPSDRVALKGRYYGVPG
jgi:hypothetical protein